MIKLSTNLSSEFKNVSQIPSQIFMLNQQTQMVSPGACSSSFGCSCSCSCGATAKS